ncbi:unnamed protein product, partial [Pylaiella littoralis]
SEERGDEPVADTCTAVYLVPSTQSLGFSRNCELQQRRSRRMRSKVVLLGCAQDAGLPQMGCACQRCAYARSNPGYEDGMPACLALVDETEGKVFLIDATPQLRHQLWYIQHTNRRGGHPLELGGILLTHAHAGHYTGLLQLGKEEADVRDVPVFCTPSMASFLQNNQPWAQLVERGNIEIRELDVDETGSNSSSDAVPVSLTPSLSVLPVLVPHRAELSDTVAYVVTIKSSRGEYAAASTTAPLSSTSQPATPAAISSRQKVVTLLYCPDTDGWSGWKRAIRSWCEDVDVALLDATFYSKDELKGRDMSEVSHPIAQVTMAELLGCKAEVVLIHLNHTNPLLTADSPERAKALAAGFKVGTFGMEWGLPSEEPSDNNAQNRLPIVI